MSTCNQCNGKGYVAKLLNYRGKHSQLKNVNLFLQPCVCNNKKSAKLKRALKLIDPDTVVKDPAGRYGVSNVQAALLLKAIKH